MWFLFDNDTCAALRLEHPKDCFDTALKLGWTNFTIEKGEDHV